MKTFLFLFSLFSAQLCFRISQNYPQLQEINQMLLEVATEAAKSQDQYKNLDEYYSQLKECDTIYYNGSILTMNEEEPVIQALSIRSGLIVQTGSTAHVFSSCRLNAKIKLINLNGRTMMPGFYDAHSHVSFHSVTKAVNLNLASPPVGTITSISQIQETIRNHIKGKELAAGSIVYCSFYNELALDQQRHITRLELDQISQDHIIVIEHISGHLAVANTMAIQQAGVTEATPDPPGGLIQRFNDGPFIGTPSGVFKEMAKVIYLNPFSKKLKNDAQSQAIMQIGIQDYIEAGVTTAQQGFIDEKTTQLLLQMKDKIKIDIRGYYACLGEYSSTFEKYSKEQTSRFKLGGIKIVVDGSIQGYTAYLTQPYSVQSYRHQTNLHLNLQKPAQPKSQDQEFRGSPIFTQEQISETTLKAFERGVDLLSHCNGDAAIDMFLQAVKRGKNIYPLSKSRVTIVHAQSIRQDQLDEVKKLGIIPSFFVGHTYYWGDAHRDVFLGAERASRISPTASAKARGIKFTLHNDAPVVPIENNGIFMIVWSAVNRLTQSGKVLSQEQRISVLQALKSLTIRAAYQGHEETSKGSIQKGKNADLIILSENPLKVQSVRLRGIQVLETIKNGVSIFKRDS